MERRTVGGRIDDWPGHDEADASHAPGLFRRILARPVTRLRKLNPENDTVARDSADPPSAPPRATEGATVAEPVRHGSGGPVGSTPIPLPPSAEGAPPRPLRIGPFTILELLGEGGMGTVYLAEQTSPMRRRVALKLIRAGAVDAQRLARFAAEREALARMSHPNIAQVYTAGSSDDGQPWIAMEYVDGVPVTDYCDERRFSIRRRVELFLTICEAIQHAHQKALLHRDLKPSNVLVKDSESGPLAKVIDFGVAKALDEPLLAGGRAMGTVVVGTPTYLSPETLAAARGEADLDTRSDVYGLGLLLFELLIGDQPFGRTSSLHVLQRILEGDVPRPSAYLLKLPTAQRREIAAARDTDPAAHRRALRGDLDWIVLKAMARDREQRYGSAADLAADLRRHLDDLPVVAGPPSTSYRLGKFVRRHRASVAGVILVTLALVGGLIARSLEAARANREAARANQEARTAREVSQFLVSIFQMSDPGRNTQPDTTAREILDRGATRLRQELTSQPLVKSRLLNAIGSIYRELGLLDQAEAMARESLALAEGADGDPAQAADTELNLATIYGMQGQGKRGEPLLQKALATFAGNGDLASQAACEAQLASILSKERRFAEAERLSLAAIRDWEAAVGPDSERIGAALNNLANMYYDQKRWSDAEAAHLRALAIKKKVFGEEHYYVAQSMSNLANVYNEEGRLAEAEQLAEKALAIKRRVLPRDHYEIGVSIHNLGDIALKAGQAERAAEFYRQAIAFWDAIPSGKGFVSYSLAGLGNAELALGRYDEAARSYDQAQARQTGPNAEIEQELAAGRAKLATARRQATTPR